MPVLKTRNAMRKLALGERVLVLVDDPLAVLDIPAFCNETGQTLVEQSDGDDKSFSFLIERQSEKL